MTIINESRLYSLIFFRKLPPPPQSASNTG